MELRAEIITPMVSRLRLVHKATSARHRMREHRQRRKAGIITVARIPITEAQRDELVAAGYLPEWSDGDAKEIEAAARKAWVDLFSRYT